jgi:N-dimethylarginine dimethylaminohydrolase
LTLLETAPAPSSRTATRRRYLMCRPEHFAVDYAINPWMDPTQPVDRERAVGQWERLVATYRGLGHDVELIEALPGHPDMVFAANGGLVYSGRALGARFAFAERQAEGPAYLDRLRTLAQVVEPVHTNEGEGDFLVVGDRVLAGFGFRTSQAAHAEAQDALGVEVLSLELVDPRYYHLDTCLAALDDSNVAYYPHAFGPAARDLLAQLYPDALLASRADAEVLGLNCVSDGHNVVIAQAATGLSRQLAEAGYRPVPVDLSELLKAGGSVKCCTMELRGPAPS